MDVRFPLHLRDVTARHIEVAYKYNPVLNNMKKSMKGRRRFVCGGHWLIDASNAIMHSSTCTTKPIQATYNPSR